MSMTKKAADKAQRLEHANQLIKIIASHGRRFFWHGGVNRWNPETKTSTWEPADRYARLELRRGRVYLIDDYTQKAVYTHPATFGNKWRGFSHGGTLRSLVEDMRDYVMHGTRIPRWRIVIERLGRNGLENNVWGYDIESAKAVRAAAYALPIIQPATEGAAA
jgi:hypothetical protein